MRRKCSSLLGFLRGPGTEYFHSHRNYLRCRKSWLEWLVTKSSIVQLGLLKGPCWCLCDGSEDGERFSNGEIHREQVQVCVESGWCLGDLKSWWWNRKKIYRGKCWTYRLRMPHSSTDIRAPSPLPSNHISIASTNGHLAHIVQTHKSWLVEQVHIKQRVVDPSKLQPHTSDCASRTRHFGLDISDSSEIETVDKPQSNAGIYHPWPGSILLRWYLPVQSCISVLDTRHD
jgi:hypothetical protein